MLNIMNVARSLLYLFSLTICLVCCGNNDEPGLSDKEPDKEQTKDPDKEPDKEPDKDPTEDPDDSKPYFADTGNKYEPIDGKCFLFVGQDMGAIGGLSDYSDGYCDKFDTPAGITVYFSLVPETTGKGLFVKSNWGAGDCYADRQAHDDRFKDCMIAIGMAMVRQENNILSGKCDETLKRYGDWFKELAPRPVFLRIGYEFDGYDWNFYQKDSYKKVFCYVKDKLEAQGVDNVAYVWQSKGYGTSVAELEQWYPGDEYVDWCSYSHFGSPDLNMIAFAEKRRKPVFIAEATPILTSPGSISDECKTTNPTQATLMWDKWFTPFFKRIDSYDCIKAISYINVDWYNQRMWKSNPLFKVVDSRLQKSTMLTKKWNNEMEDARYIDLEDFQNHFPELCGK